MSENEKISEETLVKEEPVKNKDGHVLTEVEKQRQAEFEKREKALLAKGYKEKFITTTVLKANVFGILLTLPFIALYTIPYRLWNGGFGIRKLMNENIVLYFIYIGIVIVSFIPCAVIHERIHGFFWGLGLENKSDIGYGFQKETLTPYCTCKSPLTKPVYILGSLMPMTILGVIMGIVSIFVGNICLWAIAVIQTMGGAGDILITVMLLAYKTKGKDVVLMDHPTQIGLVVFEKDKEQVKA
ncbi:MAG: DUF3267 domain-containing protein [Clostridiales bacterium]|nr:DUF3267 domain-containing protein [Clostridiales bacterium]